MPRSFSVLLISATIASFCAMEDGPFRGEEERGKYHDTIPSGLPDGTSSRKVALREPRHEIPRHATCVLGGVHEVSRCTARAGDDPHAHRMRGPELDHLPPALPLLGAFILEPRELPLPERHG